ncbi:MAG: glycosyl hydrolase family 18 protein [Thermodesulfovibrionales bacterium]|nr:glycosyl hydrolase family 18 protein [Thermodesulfovibrionales bacterium]
MKKDKMSGNIKLARLCSLLIVLLIVQFAYSKVALAQPDIWVSAYYAGWMQGCSQTENGGYLNPEDIDFSALTHIIHFAIKPNADGSLDYVEDCIFPQNSEALVDAAHVAGKKVLISLGGWLSEAAFLGATNDTNRTKFINNLINFMTNRGYDGIDIDWEPLSSSSGLQYSTFITELKDALNRESPPLVLTAAVKSQSHLFAQLQDKFEQINIMTYNLSGPWSGWITWHNAAIYDGGYIFPSTGNPVPSTNGLVDQYINAGVEASKLGIGIAFFGHVWSGGTGTPTGGVTAPGQSWITAPDVQSYIPYHELMDNYFQPQFYRWDSVAQAPYLSIDSIGSTYDKFISYDDETSCVEKIRYVKDKGLGGIMVFELGGGWRPAEPLPDSLLQSIKDATGGMPVVDPPLPDQPVLVSPPNNARAIPTNPVLTWNPSPQASSYSLQVSSDAVFASLVINASGIQGTSFSANGLSPNTRYYLRVRAQNSTGSSEWSMVWNFSTETVCITVIDNFTGYPSGRGIVLTWRTISECNTKGFEIERRSSVSTSWVYVGSVSGAGTSSVIRTYSFYDKKVRNKGTYLYRIKQVNLSGTYTYSQEITVAK